MSRIQGVGAASLVSKLRVVGAGLRVEGVPEVHWSLLRHQVHQHRPRVEPVGGVSDARVQEVLVRVRAELEPAAGFRVKGVEVEGWRGAKRTPRDVVRALITRTRNCTK